MNLKKIIFLSICLVILPTIYVYSQPNIRPVPLIPQKGKKLCWAACIDMIMEYHNPTPDTNQCTVVDLYIDKRNELRVTYPTAPRNKFHADLDMAKCERLCDTTSSIPWSAPNYDKTLLYNHTKYKSINFQPANFDLLFSWLGFYSMEDIELLSWERYKKEIDNCRPIIMMYTASGYVSTSASKIIEHAVVGRGYYRNTVTGEEYFYINDPLSICQGKEFILTRAALDNVFITSSNGAIDTINLLSLSPSINVKDIRSMVHHISLKNEDCTACESDAKMFRKKRNDKGLTTDLISVLEENQSRFTPTRFRGVYPENQLNDLNSKLEYRTKIYYLKGDALEENIDKPDFKNSIVEKPISEITYKPASPNLIATVKCNKERNACITEKIELESTKSLTNRITRMPNDETIHLTNDQTVKEKNIENIPYSIVRYEPYPYEFYRFEYNRKFYFLPGNIQTQNIFKNLESEDDFVPILEKDALQGLSIYTIKNPEIEELNTKQERKINRKLRKYNKNLEKTIYSTKK